MAAIAWSDVVAFAPQLASVDAGAQAVALAYVNATLQVDAFDGEAGPRTRIARILLAAHLGSLPGSGGNPGNVTSETVSATSLQSMYSMAAAGNGLDATSYGVELRRMYRLALFRKGPFLVAGR